MQTRTLAIVLLKLDSRDLALQKIRVTLNDSFSRAGREKPRPQPRARSASPPPLVQRLNGSYDAPLRHNAGAEEMI